MKKSLKRFFDWDDFENDIHIGGKKTYKGYEYRHNESRSDYFKRWYQKNKQRHLAKVKENQTRIAISKLKTS